MLSDRCNVSGRFAVGIVLDRVYCVTSILSHSVARVCFMANDEKSDVFSEQNLVPTLLAFVRSTLGVQGILLTETFRAPFTQ
jgi:hypothetical protein